MIRQTTVPALALALLSVLPTLASGAISQKWQSNSAYYLVAQVGDITNDGVYDLVTVEGATMRVGLRSGTTGALIAQTAGSYVAPEEFWIQNVDGDDDAEIIFHDSNTGNLIGLQYNGTSTLAVRWSYMPTPGGVPQTWEFADLDGNGQLFLVFKDEVDFHKWYVRDNNGILASTINLAAAPDGSGWSSDLFVDDYDLDGRHEVMIRYYHTSLPHVVHVFESNAPAAPAAPGASLAPGVSGLRTFPRPVKIDGRGALVVEPPLPVATRPVSPARKGW